MRPTPTPSERLLEVIYTKHFRVTILWRVPQSYSVNSYRLPQEAVVSLFRREDFNGDDGERRDHRIVLTGIRGLRSVRRWGNNGGLLLCRALSLLIVKIESAKANANSSRYSY